ncbi:ABC transporter substrate-binding protein [Paenibacillus sp. GCM10028914]|uniref:ABC transporter substrate-binding protein n=1 Tax=Paenibacillus sp. GCM10028914 TaxID=3273416 RepID=UPI00361504BF
MAKKIGFLLVSFIMMLTFASCSKDTAENKVDEVNEVKDGEKVKLVIAYQWGEEAFHKRYDPIEEYLGNVEIEYVPSDGTRQTFEELFANGIKPDMFVDQNVFALQDLEVIYPLNEFMEQENFDIGMFNPSMIESLQAYSDNGELIGLPDGTTNLALYFNKDIFDLFGQPYPDLDKPMTWPEVMDLAQEMTVVRDGVQYIGLDPSLLRFARNQFAVTATDPTTGEVQINNEEGFKRYFDMMARYYSIPGIKDTGENDPFAQKRAAMAIRNNITLAHGWGDIEYLKPFELAPFPVWPGMPDSGPETGTTPMIIANYSEHKKEALEVLKAYFEPEIMLQQVRSGGTVPPLSDPELYKQYAKDLEEYEGKNLEAYYQLTRVSTNRKSRWDVFVDLESAEKKIADGEDVVTVLRQLEEESQTKIKEAMAQQK